MAKRMTVTEYAKFRKKRGLSGGSRYGVQKALKAGRITKESDGRIDPEKADREWDANTNAAKRRGGEASPASYAEARAIREALNARITKLEYEERLGELVKVSVVRKEAYELARTLRDRLLAVPGRVAAAAAAERNTKRVEAMLTHEIRRAIEEVMGE